MKKNFKDISIKNKKATFEYFFLQEYIAGIILQGTEIKSIREGKVSISEAYCYFFKNALWIKNMHIKTYLYGNIYNHEETRERKLLLNKKELKKMMRSREQNITIVPTHLFVNNKGLAKLKIALAKGKKTHDKRNIIKERDAQRDIRNVKKTPF